MYSMESNARIARRTATDILFVGATVALLHVIPVSFTSAVTT